MEAYPENKTMSTNFEIGTDKLWIGRHAADEDILVFDPALDQPASGNVTFFSLTQFRPRSFAPKVAKERIRGITDAKEFSAAKKTYTRWPELKAKQEGVDSRTRTEALELRRSAMLQRHEAYLASLGELAEIPLTKAGRPAKRRRIINCLVCQRVLETGMDLSCERCSQSICTCGACACGASTQQVA
jgi:hypothetical protein